MFTCLTRSRPAPFDPFGWLRVDVSTVESVDNY